MVTLKKRKEKSSPIKIKHSSITQGEMGESFLKKLKIAYIQKGLTLGYTAQTKKKKFY